MSLNHVELFLKKYENVVNKDFLLLLKNNIYVTEKNDIGHSIFILKYFFPGKINKKLREIFIEYIVCVIRKSLSISKKYDKKTGYAHIYLNNCSNKNFSMKLFRNINKLLAETFEDTVEYIYIYSNSVMFKNVWKIIRNFIDNDTRKRIKLIHD